MDWAEEEIEFLKNNWDTMSLPQLSKKLNYSITKIKHKAGELGLPPKSSMGSTLCWSCDNAYAHKCEWIRDGKEIWTKATKRMDRDIIRGKVYECELIEVIECPHFEWDRRYRRMK